MAVPDARFALAFNQPTLEPDPDWTVLDDTPNLVVSYTIDRGRQYELDRTDVGRATVQISDRHGILDPTNSSGPYYGWLEPLVQAVIRRKNPVTGTWYTRYRGFVEDYAYDFDPSQKVNRLTLTLIDVFEILSSVQMMPGHFGMDPTAATPPVPDAVGQVWFEEDTMQDRILAVVGPDGAQLPDAFYVVFSGNVRVARASYSPGESAMTAVQEAADAEFVGVSNVYTDKFGRLAVHGRLSKFDPAGVHSGASPGAWDFHEWNAGDGAAVAASPTDTAQLRQFAFERGLSKIINQALATPAGIADEDMPDGTPVSLGGSLEQDHQLIYDTASIAQYGIRSQSWQNLLTIHGILGDVDALTETARVASYYVQNYAVPQNRVTLCGFRSIGLTATGAAATWNLISQVDISDTLALTVGSPGGGGFNLEPFFVEGVHEQVQPLNPEMDDVTLTLDLSPRQYFTTDPWPTS